MNFVGQVIDDKYEILTSIGKGGMSEVFLARDRRLNKQWAIKIVPKKTRDKANEIVVQSAIAEANMIKQLDHTAIVRIVDILEDPNYIYIIEDYIEGETLNTILKQNGAQPQELVIEWAMQICEALEYLHTRKPPIIYRDMKPSNVMLRPDGNIKIIDFGIAREYKDHSLADTVSLGTKGYAAPEQFGGKGQTDARTDVYCLGVTLYHLVTGKNPCEPPYEIYPIRYWNPQLDPGFEAIIEKCTQLNPNDRYQSCAELLYALQHYHENGAAYRKIQKKKLGAFIATSAACLLFLIVGIVGLVMKTYINDKDYDNNFRLGNEESDYDKKVEYYTNAIKIIPDRSDAYFTLIDTFKADRSFTQDEEKVLLNVLHLKDDENQDTNQSDNKQGSLSWLNKTDFYGKLSYEIGKLYWGYYDYGQDENGNSSENDITRRKSATYWFGEAVSHSSKSDEFYYKAKLFNQTGDFISSIEFQLEEGDIPQNTFKNQWKNISLIVEEARKDNADDEVMDLEACRLTVSTIIQYAHKFSRDNVSRKEMTDLLDSVEDYLREIDEVTSNDESFNPKVDKVKEKLPVARKAIANAFKNKEN